MHLVRGASGLVCCLPSSFTNGAATVFCEGGLPQPKVVDTPEMILLFLFAAEVSVLLGVLCWLIRFLYRSFRNLETNRSLRTKRPGER